MRAPKLEYVPTVAALLLLWGVALFFSGRDIDVRDAQLANAIAAAQPQAGALSALPKALWAGLTAVMQTAEAGAPLYTAGQSLWVWALGEELLTLRLPLLWAVMLGGATLYRGRPPRWWLWGAAVALPTALVGFVDGRTAFFLLAIIWSSGALVALRHKRTKRRALLYLLTSVALLLSHKAAIIVLALQVAIYRAGVTLKPQGRRYGWALSGAALAVALLLGALFKPPSNTYQNALAAIEAARSPLEPMLLAYNQQPVMVYYERVSGFRQGIAIALNWRERDSAELDALLQRLDTQGSVWLVMATDDEQGRYVWAALAAERAIGYQAAVADTLFARFDKREG